MAETEGRPAGAARAIARRHVDGVLLVDKPAGPSSNAVLGHIRRLYCAAKAGHTGTLDPLASGLLPICLGAATRYSGMLLDAPKRYLATVRFGIATTTSDAEGEVTELRPVAFDEARLTAVLERSIGPQLQVPPKYSALKFGGRPHYEYARAGIDVPRVPREITIHSLQLVEWNAPDATIAIECSKGTYVRALAASLGDELGCGAHLASLRRTGSGGFDVNDAVTIEAMEALDALARDRLLRPASVLVAHLPRVELDRAAARSFRRGQPIACPGAALASPYTLRAVFEGNTLIGTGEIRDDLLHPGRLTPEAVSSAATSSAATSSTATSGTDADASPG